MNYKKWDIKRQNYFIPNVRKPRLTTGTIIPWMKVREINLQTNKERIKYVYFEWSDLVWELYINHKFVEESPTLIERSQRTIEFYYDPSRSGDQFIYANRSSASRDEYMVTSCQVISWGVITIDNLNKLFVEFYEKVKGVYRYRGDCNETLNKKAIYKLKSITDCRFTARELKLHAYESLELYPSPEQIIAVRSNALDINYS